MNEPPSSSGYTPADPFGRQPAQPYGAPPVQRQRVARRPVVTLALIAITVLVFAAQLLSEAVFGTDIPALYGAKINEAILAGQFWRLLTPVLLHGSILHIAFNMYALYVIGSGLETYYGPTRYLLLYLVSGFAGNVFSFLFSANPSLGASTAVFGLVAAEGVFVFQNRFLFRNPRGVLTNILMIVAVNLFLGLSPGIDNWGHLGGLFGGVAVAWFGGPRYEVNNLLGSYHVEDTRETQGMWITAAGVTLFFALLAYTRFL
ncbi:MAG TPA: rhomboid family intramembrane serine protease [Anaerolineaceae bacterium]|nr:rhomboid family intramembrane serine protease [Anaerolineaceae bacterium]